MTQQQKQDIAEETEAAIQNGIINLDCSDPEDKGIVLALEAMAEELGGIPNV